ncbi:MAG TPA: alkaline phosphatase family protein [Gemmatimonadales bacterium]|jgi:predicted AlkP superfamily pyrophosphatase or phosphodiesterase
MRLATILALVLVGGCASPARAPKVLLIGLDGVRVDKLVEATTPNIDALVATGALSMTAHTGRPTVSGPGWSSMLIGVWPEKHGVLGNDFAGNAYGAYPDFLTRLEQVDPTFRTYAVVDWPPLASTASNGPLLSGAIDSIALVDGDVIGYGPADSISAELAADYLATGEVDAAFVYLGNIDVVGHETSSLDPAYRMAIETADRQVGTLLNAVRSRPTYAGEDWLILMSTDHGRRDDGGHGGNSALEQTIFVLASGPGVRVGSIEPSPGIVDVAATALVHLGVALDSSWRLDGVPLRLSASDRR